MTERSYFWDGTATGDASLAPYTNDEYSDFWADIFLRDRLNQGVFATSNPYVSLMPSQFQLVHIPKTTIQIRPGVGLADGKLFISKLTHERELTEDYYYRFTLLKYWDGQTVRIGTSSSSGGWPTMTQTDGVMWQIPLWRVRYSNSVLTTIDDRYFYNNPTVLYRQGGNASNWNTGGSTVYRTPQAHVQMGSLAVAANPQTVNFPQAFLASTEPLVFVTLYDTATAPSTNLYWVNAITHAAFDVRFDSITNLDSMFWIAIGHYDPDL
jgi:hypothetical protein